MDHKDLSGEEAENLPPSKSQRKREMHALQDLGKQLIDLSDDQLAQLNLDRALVDAIDLARRTRSREALRRQIQYIGKLMRQAPHEEIAAALASLQREGTLETENLHLYEREREALLMSDDALTQWFETHPHADHQQVRSTLLAARREKARNEKLTAAAADPQKMQHKHYRALFQIIKATHHAARKAGDFT